MNANKKLDRAKKAKNDEFYTRYSDIEKEMLLHKEHFKDKVVYCPCDDYEKSEFVKFFLDHYDSFELKGLIATSYAYSGEKEADLFSGEVKKGKVLVKTFDDVHYGFLEGTGDFRSKECTSLKEKCDIIATNPPFSLFREFFSWAKDKDLELVAPIGCVNYSDLFPCFKSRKLIVGKRLKEFVTLEGGKAKVPSYWISTYDYLCQFLKLTEKYSPEKYPKYDNYNAINVDKIKDIPIDYFEAMGVPVTFLEKWNPSQFEVLGITKRGAGTTLKSKVYTKKDYPSYSTSLLGDLNRGAVLIDENKLRTRVYISKECHDAYYKLIGKPGNYDLNATGVFNGKKLFSRILIRRKRA